MNASTSNPKFQLIPFLISLGIVLAIGIVASLVTTPQITGWYTTLQKPSFNPPNWLFAPVWTLIYLLIAVAAYLVWQRRDSSTNYLTTRALYILQLALNFSWSIVFFGLHSLVGGLLIILLLWMMIFLNIRWFGKFNKVAGWLLFPYFLWVSFAAILNFSIYWINR
jgi:benzodiazapine receptor